MTRDEVIKLAREAGFTLQRGEWLFTEMLEHFAHLVAKYERESCAKMCEEFPYDCLGCLDDCAAAIRSRSNT